MRQVCRLWNELVEEYFKHTSLHLDLLWPLWFLDEIDRIPTANRSLFLECLLSQPERVASVTEFGIERWDACAEKELGRLVRQLLTSPEVMPNLRDVCFERSDKKFSVTPRFLAAVGQAHPRIERLRMYNCTPALPFSEDSLMAWGRSMPNLRTFRVKDTTFGYMDDSGLFSLLHNWPLLEELELTVHRKPSFITDDGLHSLVNTTANLKILSLRLERITWQGLESILRSNPKLTVLDLSQCERLGGPVVQSLSRYASRLEVLHAHCCPWMSNKALDRLVHSTSPLRTIGVDNTRVTPAGLRRVLEKQPPFLGKGRPNSLHAAIDVGYFYSALEAEIEGSDEDADHHGIMKEWLAIARDFEVNFAVNRFQEN